MDLKEVQGFIDQNKSNADVQKYIGSFVDADRVNAFLDSDEGGKLIQPRVDKHFTKGLETWKEKNLPTVIEEEMKKRNPAETEEQKRLRKLEGELDTEKKKRSRQELKNKAIEAMSGKLPNELLPVVDYFIREDETSTVDAINNFAKVLNKIIDAKVVDEFKKSGRSKPGPVDSTKTGNAAVNDLIRKAAGF